MNEFISLLWKLSVALTIVGLGLFVMNGPETALGQMFFRAAMLGLAGIAMLQIGGILNDVWQSIAPDIRRLLGKATGRAVPHTAQKTEDPVIEDVVYQTPARRQRPKRTGNDDLIP